MKCKECGAEVAPGLRFCTECGGRVEEIIEEVVSEEKPVSSYAASEDHSTYERPAPSSSYDPMIDKARGKATAALVLGIIAMVLVFTYYLGFIAMILAIIGLVCASAAKKGGYNGGVRKAGFGISLGALIVSCIEVALGIIIVAVAVTSIGSMDQDALKKFIEENGSVSYNYEIDDVFDV